MSRQVLYSTDGLSKNYPLGQVTVHALREASVEVYEGEFIVILGPSGSGKSTLLNLLGGMDTPSSGTVRFHDTDISGFSEQELTQYRRKHVGFVFQFFNLVPTLNALENVELAAEVAPDPLDSLETLELVDLADRADHFPSQLSGGEQQRVAIARAVAKNPEVLLCDEPTGALDYEIGKTVLGVLRRVHREKGKTIIIVTHNAAIGGMGNRVLRMRSGKVREITENEKPLEADQLQW